MLVGWLLRELGPRIRDRAPAEGTVLSGGELVTRMAWARFCGTCGMALLLCGLLVLIVAGILTLVSTGDDLGTTIILGVFALTVVLMLLWTALYLRQFGTQGIFRRKKQASSTTAIADEQHEEDAPAGVAPEQADDIQQAPDYVPFEQAATSRGGFGRFAGFIRREPEPDVTDVGDDDADRDAFEGDLGEQQPEDEKVLTASDPLVTEPLEDRGAGELVEPVDDVPDDPESEAEPTADAIATLRQRRIERLARNPGTTTN